MPSSAEYIHIGEITTRLRAVMPRSTTGVKSLAVMRLFLIPKHLLRRGEQRIRAAPKLRLVIGVSFVAHLALRNAENRLGAVTREIFRVDVVVDVHRHRSDWD